MDDARAERTAPSYRSKAWLGLGPFAVVLACGVACSSPAPRLVTVYTPMACAAPAVNATYQATGDFSLPAPDVAPLFGIGQPLSALPADTRSMLVEIEGWSGVSLVDPSGPVDVLVLPSLPFPRICAMPGRVNAPVSGTDPGDAIGLIDVHHALVVGGSVASVIDLGTGAIAPASPELLVARDDASVTPHGSGALVAGGTDPGSGQPVASAEVYESPSTGVGGFNRAGGVLLAAPRTKHGAVQLASGETLVLGGFGGSGGGRALSSLEYVPVGAGVSNALGVSLSQPRVRPAILRLPNGKIFVGGGFEDFDETNPIASVEWLDADLGVLQSNSARPAPVNLCMTAGVQAFAPLEDGAVLAVFGAKPPSGCSNVLVIRPDFKTIDQALPLLPPPVAPMLLFAGAASSPVLLTAEDVRQWDPWSGGWISLGVAPSDVLPTTAMLSADPGLALWVAQDGAVHALRFATRNAYSTDPPTKGPLLVSDPSEFAPDRLVGADVSWINEKGLELQNGASAFLTDATFADFSIDFTANGSVQLVLRDNDTGQLFFYAPGFCFPPSVTNVQLERHGAIVSYVGAGQSTPCNSGNLQATERVAIGFTGLGPKAATVSSVTVQRLASTE